MATQDASDDRMTLNIIGISAHQHDSACCLLQDGRLVAAAEEERFSRIKHDPAIPSEAFRYCLREGGLTPGDVDRLAYYETPRRRLERQLWMEWQDDAGDDASLPASTDPHRPARELRDALGYEGEILYCDHHLSHAASSFYFSGFEEAAIMIVDGVGEWATTTYAHGSGANIVVRDEVRFPDSLGLLYSAVTSYLGFDVNDAEYKVMGLAPYGEPTHVDGVRTLLQSWPGGQYRLDLRYFDFRREDRMYSDAFAELFGHPARQPDAPIDRFHRDLSRSLQVVLEETLLEKVRFLHDRVPCERLCLAGGVALNCVANRRILQDGPFERMFVQPAASDAGAALGAAATAHVQLTGRRPSSEALEHVYLGPRYASGEIEDLLKGLSIRVSKYEGAEAALIEAVAERLARGEVVGWFHGRMEFGPRALGARSILADARRPEMRDRINTLVKGREAFRPFAPAVLASKATQHFAIDHASPFMLETCQVCSPLDLPAVTHVDGSARVQTVSMGTSPRFARLLEAFDRRTGCPILLNTSFNLRGEPIVMRPIDALWCFIRSALDLLVLEDVVIDAKDIPSAWRVIGRTDSGTPPRRWVSRRVYTGL